MKEEWKDGWGYVRWSQVGVYERVWRSERRGTCSGRPRAWEPQTRPSQSSTLVVSRRSTRRYRYALKLSSMECQLITALVTKVISFSSKLRRKRLKIKAPAHEKLVEEVGPRLRRRARECTEPPIS